MLQLSREQVLAHRVAAHGLVERVAAVDDVAVLDLGVQNSPPGALPVALSAWLAEPLVGAPGVVLSGVDIVGTWRTTQRGRSMDVTIGEFRTLRPRERAALGEEAERLAVVRGVHLGAVG